MNEIIGAVLAAIASVLVTFVGSRWIRKWRRFRFERGTGLHVRRIEESDDRDLLGALDLLERRIPDNERDSPETIVRWIREVAEETGRGVNKLIDYFVVAKWRGRVVGLCYAQYYLRSQLMFVSFLVVDEDTSIGRRGDVAISIISYLVRQLRRRALRECKGIVFEVEHPAEAPDVSGRQERVARIRRFETLGMASGIVVRVLGVPYLQPSLEIWSGSYSEQRLCLMYARTKKPLQGSIPRSEATKVLRFVYDEIYGDHFEDDKRRHREFNQYLKVLQQRVTAEMPDRVEVSPYPPSIQARS